MTSFTRGSVYTALRWILLFAIAVMMIGLLQLLHLRPVFADTDTGGYPWYDAKYVDANYDWGYNPCPPSDPKCMKMIDKGYGTADPWGYNLRNCTSYVAWKINQVFSKNISGWGNASSWYTSAKKAGYTFDSTPQVSDIAQWNGTRTNPDGHVAYVYQVSGGVATFDEYNVAGTGSFTSNFTSTNHPGGAPNNYIHIGNLTAPWPGVGSATFLNADHLNNGQTMTSSQYILSGNVQHALIMQSDGNLVEYSGTTATWASNTGGHAGAYLGLQGDGNIVVYSFSHQVLWSSNTGGQSLSYLDMQDDGNLVAYNTSGSSIWASNTDGFSVFTFVGADHLNDGATLTSGNYIRSADKRYALLMQPDGNLVLYGPGYHVLWSTGTNNHSGAYFGLQGDGNMVVYSSSNQVLWASNTNGKSLSYLVLQTDGNLVAVNTSGSPIWATNTNGKI